MNSIEEWIDQLKETEKLILVEGINDKKALIKLGISKRKIIYLNGPLYEIVEKICKKTKDCILLFDLDKEGKKLYSKLRNDLQKFGVRIDKKFREFLFNNTRITYIEKIKLE